MSEPWLRSAVRVFVARHGERVDHVNPSWKRTANRPHDAPLTDNGVGMGAKLGRWIAEVRKQKIDKVYTSPLLRCVQTANAAAAELGLEERTICLEPGLIEEDYWLRRDVAAGSSSNVLPWALDANTFREEVGVDRVNEHHDSLSSLSIDEEGYDALDFASRCSETIKKIVSNPSNDGKVLLIVGHGNSVAECIRALVPDAPIAGMADYTGVTEIELCSGSGSGNDASPAAMWRVVGKLHSLEHLKSKCAIC